MFNEIGHIEWKTLVDCLTNYMNSIRKLYTIQSITKLVEWLKTRLHKLEKRVDEKTNRIENGIAEKNNFFSPLMFFFPFLYMFQMD